MNARRTIQCIAFAILISLSVWGAAQEQASDQLAITLEVIYDSVDVQREDTTQWFTLDAGVQMPFGAGDKIRTGQRGRVWLRLPDNMTILLLSQSEFMLDAIADSDDGLVFHAHFTEGTLVQETFIAPVDYRLITQDGVITAPGDVMEVRSEAGQADTVVSAAGEVMFMVAEDSYTLSSGQGSRLNDVSEIADIEAPYSSGRLIAALDGCPGIIEVDTSRFRTIIVRNTYENSFSTGAGILNGAQVSIVGQSPDGSWLRVQFAHDFGWVIANGVNSDCNPPVIENIVIEDWFPIVAPTEEELALLLPLYG
ncbi:MAG: hypothetical protein ACPG7F_21890, partial [Aggregatilineales bacterium]